MPRAARRQERINLRLSPDSKDTLKRAAAYADKTLTDFVIDVALRQATSVVREHETIALTAPEWHRFRKLLLNPPKPNKRLRKAFAEHAKTVRP